MLTRWILPLALAAACAHKEQTVPAEPQHVPGATEQWEAIPKPAAQAEPESGAEGRAGVGGGGGQMEAGEGGPRAALASGTTDPTVGRIKARPHAQRNPGGTSGVHRLGLGKRRDGVIFVPRSYDPSRPAPLMLLLHGGGRDHEEMLDYFRDRAEAHGVILVLPDSREKTWDLLLLHRFGGDVAFIDQALAMAFDGWNVDSSRVAVGGFSDGASEALSLGLTNGDLFGQILAFSPGFAAPALVTGQPRVFIAHGRDDRVLPVQRTTGRLVPVLEKTGYDLRFKEFEGGHEMPDHVLDAAFSWFETGR